MTAARKTEAAGAGSDGRADAAELELARQLAGRAQAEGLSLTGPGGLLGRLAKVVLEGALEGEMDAHLGYAKHDLAGRDGGNIRQTRKRASGGISARNVPRLLAGVRWFLNVTVSQLQCQARHLSSASDRANAEPAVTILARLPSTMRAPPPGAATSTGP